MSELSYIGENIDLILGQEFLTWLWFRSETAAVFHMEEGNEPFTVAMEQRIVVRGGEGESMETATVSGSLSPLREARLGLQTGKQVVRALVKTEKDGMEWQVTLKAEDLSFNSFRTPKVDRSDASDDPDALFLEKAYLMELGLSMLDEMFKSFLQIRLSEEAWFKEIKKIAQWMEHDLSEGAFLPEI